MMEKVTTYDVYDTERKNPVELKLKEIEKGRTFNIDSVTYKIERVFKKDGQRCIELRMIKYKIPNGATVFVHKCPAKKRMMKKMTQEGKEQIAKKYGEHTLKAWCEGRIKMKTALATVCPDCECVFWKDKDEPPEPVEVVSLKGKKQLTKRNK